MIHFKSEMMSRNERYYVAVSGGVDSMICFDFLYKGGWDVQPFYVDHLTEYGCAMRTFVEEVMYQKYAKLLTWRAIVGIKPNGVSQEEYWRNERYKHLLALPRKVILCHHLDDNIENWVMTSLHGNGRLMPWGRDNIIRPFMMSSKSDFIEWSVKHNVQYHDDPSNICMDHKRNLVRHQMMPLVLSVNPGIRKVVKKKLAKTFVDWQENNKDN